MKLVRLNKIRTFTRVSGLGGALLSLALASGCPSDVGTDTQPDISPSTIFDTTVKASLITSCQPCHGVAQGASVPAFLAAGMEYQSITSYQSGKFINVPMSNQSLILQKGQHTGPALTADQYSAVQNWIDAEIAARPSTMAGMTKSALLPTVPVTTGDFNMNLGSIAPINDPLANVTFHLAPDSSGLFRISKLTLTTGPTTGIHIQHPKLYFISDSKSYADPADSLATVDQQVPASSSAAIGSGTVLLTNAPSNDPNTRFGLAFTVLETYKGTNVMVMCKDMKDFTPPVTTDLKTYCAATCHAGKNSSATSAFDMTASSATDMPTLANFCVQALGRLNLQMPSMSILLLQALPTANGGTPNHPFKFSQQTDITRYSMEINAWGMGEK